MVLSKKQLLGSLLLLSILYLLGCNNHKPNKTRKKSDYQEIKVTRVKFNYNQTFEIKEIKKGHSISDIFVSGIGFQNSSNTIKYADVYPFEDLIITDIDTDGFEELYIITRSAGSGSYAELIGITSIKGKSYKTIYIPEYDNKLDTTYNYLNGYMGHDSIYVNNKQLCREFPIYKPTDYNANPTGGKRKIIYKLVEYNNSFSLQVDSVKMLN